MSSHDPTVDHPRPREAVEWVVSTLRAGGDVQDLLGVANATEAEEVVLPHRQRVGADGLPERFLVARERVDAGGRAQRFSGLDLVPIQVMSECRKTLPNIERWHEEIQHAVFEAIVGETPSLSTGRAAEPIRRSRKPGRPLFDATDQTFYSTATFRTTLRP